MPEFKCGTCGALFPSQEALMQHDASAHKQPKAQSFACQVCGAAFPSQAELQAHTKAAHPM
jgi:uncharacterized C2H2 Zn-finger protein